jgi:trans-aconitate 2-methyltransferase
VSWSPEQYLRFAAPRLRPALDLLARIALEAPARICDLGCGAGNVTAWLARRWPGSRITGVDASAEMLAEAARELPGVQWVQADLARWRPEAPVELIYSNAALHWLPDHDALLPSLVASLAAGGVLAVQMPRNFDAPSHTAIAQSVRAGPWRARLEPLLAPAPVAEPRHYHALLAPLAAELDIWQTEYLHRLEGADPVKEWTKGTWLKSFLDALGDDPSQRDAFEADYAARVRRAYPREADGATLLPFKRLFIVLRKA